MQINSLPNHPYFFPYEEDIQISKPNMTLVILLLCIAGPFWLIISLIRGTLKDDIRLAMHPAQSK